MGLMCKMVAYPFEFINTLRLGVFAVEFGISSSTDFKDRH
jgi:hypothetical protein